MSVPRYIMTCCAAGVLLGGPATAATEVQNPEATLHDVISRLDKTLLRLDQLEQRIARIEDRLFSTRLQPDKHGIIRDESGRPIGTWGIDYPMIEERARR